MAVDYSLAPWLARQRTPGAGLLQLLQLQQRQKQLGMEGQRTQMQLEDASDRRTSAAQAALARKTALDAIGRIPSDDPQRASKVADIMRTAAMQTGPITSGMFPAVPKQEPRILQLPTGQIPGLPPTPDPNNPNAPGTGNVEALFNPNSGTASIVRPPNPRRDFPAEQAAALAGKMKLQEAALKAKSDQSTSANLAKDKLAKEKQSADLLKPARPTPIDVAEYKALQSKYDKLSALWDGAKGDEKSALGQQMKNVFKDMRDIRMKFGGGAVGASPSSAPATPVSSPSPQPTQPDSSISPKEDELPKGVKVTRIDQPSTPVVSAPEPPMSKSAQDLMSALTKPAVSTVPLESAKPVTPEKPAFGKLDKQNVTLLSGNELESILAKHIPNPRNLHKTDFVAPWSPNFDNNLIARAIDSMPDGAEKNQLEIVAKEYQNKNRDWPSK